MQLRATRLTAIAHAARKAAAFNPSSLFSAGEQGWWYDPSNFSTLFQDSAGTTPVTAVEQPVGLQLDLSKGLVLGSEILTNGTFDSSIAGWTAGAGSAAWVAGTAQITGSSGVIARLYQGMTLTAGQWYRMTATCVSTTDASATLEFLGGSVSTTFTSGQTKSLYFSPASTGTFYAQVRNTNAGAVVSSFDNISVQSLAGNHRFQTTSANRPVVSARVNLLTKTEDLTNAAWGSNVTVTVSSGVTDPLGGVTAFSVTANGANSRLGQIVAFAGAMTQNFWVRRRTGTGVINYFNGLAYVALTGVTNDWQQLSVITSPSAPSNYFILQLVTSGDAVDVWRPDLRPTNQGVGLPAYQRVNTSTDYDSTGFPIYIKPNGSNQFMVTNSINFSSTDKMTVWQGVRKLSDAGTGILTELSINFASNNGSFAAGAPDTSPPGYSYTFIGKGSAAVSVSQLASFPLATYSAPRTNVLASTGDISGDLNTLRVNTVAATNATGDQGTGNFGNYPAYFYARAGTSLFFNGHDYGSIARGAASTAAQITAGETYMNSKTKAY